MKPTRLTFHGAAGTVTGSKILLEHGPTRALVDCGLFQGYKALRELNWKAPPVDPRTLDAVLLTHAHIDHSGYLPLLVRQGFRGKIFATPSTAALCSILLPDAAHLQEEEAERANRKGTSKHSPALPLYTTEEARAVMSHFHTVRFGESIPIDGATCTFHRVGHILGAASLRIDTGDHAVLFSGDVGRPEDPLLGPPEPPPECDAMVLECTYADRKHADEDPEEQLGEVLRRTFARGGLVIIPAFAVGRVQRVLYHLLRLMASGAVQRVPVYLDSPLAKAATDVFRRYGVMHGLPREDVDAICDLAITVETQEDSKALDRKGTPCVIIAGSGMATGGRVIHHIRRYAPEPQHTVLFTGYQAGGTRGDRMVRGEAEVMIFGESVPVRCEVAMLDNLSAHADGDELIAWLRSGATLPSHVWLDHGSEASCDRLRIRLKRELGIAATVPLMGEGFDVG